MQHGADKVPLPAAVLLECQRDRADVAELIGDAGAEEVLLLIKDEVPRPAFPEDDLSPGPGAAVLIKACASEPSPDPPCAARSVRLASIRILRTEISGLIILIVAVIIPAVKVIRHIVIVPESPPAPAPHGLLTILRIIPELLNPVVDAEPAEDEHQPRIPGDSRSSPERERE